MPNAMYPTARQKFGEAGINWVSNDIKVALLDATYVYNEAHEFHDDLLGILATSANLTGKTNVLGVLDADDLLITPVTGDIVEFVVFKDTGSSATSPLLFFFDRNASSVAIVLTAIADSVVIRWSNGPNKIARI